MLHLWTQTTRGCLKTDQEGSTGEKETRQNNNCKHSACYLAVLYFVCNGTCGSSTGRARGNFPNLHERVMLSRVRLLLKCALFGVYVNCVYYSVTVYLVTYTVVSWSTRAEPRWNGVEDPSLEGVVL